MKWILLILPIFAFANVIEKNDTITNKTNIDMLCVAQYPSVYGEKDVNGQKRQIEIEQREEVIKTIKPGKSFKKKRKGYLNCFNETVYIKSREANDIEVSNKYAIESHVNNHNSYDLTTYEGKNLAYVGKNLGIPQACGSYKGGKYCNHAFGLDIFYDTNNNVKNIYLYGNTVGNGKLPFKPESIFKLRNNEGPLGLWVRDNYKKLFSKKPSYYSKNLIVWTNPSKYIKQVSMTPKNGYFKLSRKMKNKSNLFKDGWTDSETALDYIQAIEVEYK